MSNYFLGQIRAFPFNYAPEDFLPCEGQLLPITHNEALFSLLGTTYGGNGQNNFQLPNLNNRAPIGSGAGPGLTPREAGPWGGEVQVALTLTELPNHNHSLNATSDLATERQPPGQVFAQGDGVSAFGPNSWAVSQFYPGAVSDAGNGAPHNNLMAFLTLNLCFCVRGDFPPH
jgi:microcystin-dependent protein